MYDYSHGGNAVFEPGAQNVLDLSANINPLGFPEGVKDAVTAAIPYMTRYPDSISRELRDAIGLWEKVEPDRIFCGNGASDIIFRIPVCLKPKTALLPAPTFSDYERALKSSGAKVRYAYLREDEGFSLSSDITRLIKETDIIFLCNPNNPTGVITEFEEMENIISYCKKNGVYVIADECFLDFTENAHKTTVKPLINKYDNLIILKAFTKLFALPGIRLGYAICGNPAIISKLYESGADWPVSNLAQEAGIAAVKSALTGTYLQDTVSAVSSERAFLTGALNRLGYITFNSKANYLFFKNPYEFNLFNKLDQFNIRIRSCGNYEGLSSDFYRTAVSNEADNREFIRVMEEIQKV